MSKSKFEGGSPISDPNNPYGDGHTLAQQDDIVMGLDPEGRQSIALSDLMGSYGSQPVADDAAAQRPLNPPTTQP